MVLDARMIRFSTCDSSNSNPLQQWEILKSEKDRNNIRICRSPFVGPFGRLLSCLIAPDPFDQNLYQSFHRTDTIEPSNEARRLFISNPVESDPSQHWLMNSTTHQLANVRYPKGCLTTRHFQQEPAYPLLLECDGYGYESPNPQLSKHQRFYPMPALDKNREQLCAD